MESTNLSAGLLGPAPSGPAPAPRMPSGWGEKRLLSDTSQVGTMAPQRSFFFVIVCVSGSGPALGLGMSRQNHSEPNVVSFSWNVDGP